MIDCWPMEKVISIILRSNLKHKLKPLFYAAFDLSGLAKHSMQSKFIFQSDKEKAAGSREALAVWKSLKTKI